MKHTAGVILRTVVLILVGIAIGLFIGNENFPNHPLRFNFAGGSDKISKVLNLVSNKYVDSVNTDSIEGVTVNDMLQSLDPHSVYLPAQQAQNINERLEGGFTGIGLEYQLLRDTVIITQVYPGGPAAKAGLATGDRVITVDSTAFSGTKLTVARISKAFRGEKDTHVLLGIAKTAKGPVKEYSITRGRVALSSLDAAYMADAKTGYIKISKFASTTDSDFRAALVNLRVDGMEKLILDLRGNGGGYLNTATALADEFLPRDKLIVYTLGIHEPRTDYFATDSGSYEAGPLTVLIDEYSASASEILAGAMQDLDRATIVGRRSFGKGLVQQQFPFGDGTAVNLTVARYYTPSGRSIQKSYSKGIANYRNELAERVRKGELLTAGSNLSDSAFLSGAAFHTQKGRKVFSRGGIMPDVFVPADTSQNTQLLYELNSNQLFTAYVIDKLQTELKNYPTADAFISNYQVTDNELHHFVMYAAQTLKFMDSHELLVSGNVIRSLIKANAARFKWGNNAYYQVLNDTDNTVKVALKQ